MASKGKQSFILRFFFVVGELEKKSVVQGDVCYYFLSIRYIFRYFASSDLNLSNKAKQSIPSMKDLW